MGWGAHHYVAGAHVQDSQQVQKLSAAGMCFYGGVADGGHPPESIHDAACIDYCATQNNHAYGT